MKPTTATAAIAMPVIAALTLMTAGPAQADTVHTRSVQVTTFSDPCHPDSTGTLDLSFRQVQLTPDHQSKQIETGDFTFTPNNPPGLAATGHFVDQQTFTSGDPPGAATLTEAIHAVAHYSDGIQNPIQLTTVTTFVNYTAVDTQVVKTVCGG
jgi:hypothetical protein